MRRATRPRLRERGSALLLAMLTVTLVATLAAASLWQQWQAVAIEQAQRERTQAALILQGALDWARLILREDARANQREGNPDHEGAPEACRGAQAASRAEDSGADEVHHEVERHPGAGVRTRGERRLLLGPVQRPRPRGQGLFF